MAIRFRINMPCANLNAVNWFTLMKPKILSLFSCLKSGNFAMLLGCFSMRIHLAASTSFWVLLRAENSPIQFATLHNSNIRHYSGTEIVLLKQAEKWLPQKYITGQNMQIKRTFHKFTLVQKGWCPARSYHFTTIRYIVTLTQSATKCGEPFKEIHDC